MDNIFEFYPDYFDYSEYDEVGHMKIKKARVMGIGSDYFL